MHNKQDKQKYMKILGIKRKHASRFETMNSQYNSHLFLYKTVIIQNILKMTSYHLYMYKYNTLLVRYFALI